ncbi:unnamed protein product [Hermetia illucens]|uniref:Uncharacterized protein n=1 Tax=Hermetia illucens TaxID=343691 RepID=A0A7R8UDF7_HERIL|nr:circadian clock-controlled protein daywake-like [Hermetia illucens]CAD7077902.1 unnamed protein product [Hermetia illucens]
MFKLWSLFLLIACGYVHGAKHLTEQPSFLQPCPSSDTQCFTKSIQTFWSQLKTGIPGLSSIPKLDPLRINKVNVVQDQAQNVNVSATLTNAEITGMADTIVKNAKYDKQKGIFSFDLDFPKLKMVSDYALKGRILLLQLNGQGKMYMSAENTEARLNVLTEVVEEDGEKFFHVKAVRMHYKLKSVKTKLENLFNGNKELEDSANQLFNENWEELNVAFEPVLTKTAEEILLNSMRKIFHYIPAKYVINDV